MFWYWWEIFWQSLDDSLKVVGKESSDILFSIIVFIIVGVLLIRRGGWPQGGSALKEKILRSLGEDIAIVLVLFGLIIVYHMGKNSYEKWKETDDRAKQS